MNGTILGNRYLLINVIGAGGMGTVYRATDLRTGGPVAVKLLHPALTQGRAYVQRLRREAELAASLTSPRVVRVIDVETESGTPYLVMEYVPGPTLGDLVRESGRLPPEEALRIAIEVARALAAAHSAGIVHRDLKPDNIKLVDGQVKVLDFGIARLTTADGPTVTGDYLGTPEYSAPEQMEGRGDIRCDIYALGVILFRLVEGDLPFTGPTPLAVLQQHARAPVPAMHFAPPQVALVVRRCLEKRPEDRYQTPGELVAALQAAQAAAGTMSAAPTLGKTASPPLAWAGSSPTPRSPTSAPTVLHEGERSLDPTPTAPPTEPMPPKRDHGRRRLGLAIAGGAVLLIALAGAGLLLSIDRDDDAGARSDVQAATAAPDGGPAWFLAGSARADSGGAWRFKQTVPRALMSEGFVRTKVTEGGCEAPSDNLIAYEGTLLPERRDYDFWEVIVEPSPRAAAGPKLATGGAAILRERTDGRTDVEISLDGMPARTPFNVCFRQQ
jgi:serine/threonine-protein kinase